MIDPTRALITAYDALSLQNNSTHEFIDREDTKVNDRENNKDNNREKIKENSKEHAKKC